MIAMTELLLAGFGGLVAGVGVMLIYSLAIGKGAKAKAEEVLNEAQRAADAKLKDAEIEIKEKALKLEASAERELGKSREKLHQRERALDKRETGLSQQVDDLRKQEQFIETNQNRLKVKLQQASQTRI